MIIRNWRNCPTSISHGYFIQREILSKIDLESPSKEGAVMKHIDSFCRAYLEPLSTSTETIHDNIQEILYIVNGEGSLIIDGEENFISEGDAVIIPPGLPHILDNEINEPLEFLILVETVPEGFKTRTEPLFRNYRESPIGQGHWNHLVHKLFDGNDGLAKINSVLIVGIEAMQTADTHGHNDRTDEIWYMLKGNGLHVVDREIRRQVAGDAVPVAPSMGHSLINDTDEPLQTFYFAHHE
jgi:mannose-6-phosphate isomerase-like protein (cupin superfamily)